MVWVGFTFLVATHSLCTFCLQKVRVAPGTSATSPGLASCSKELRRMWNGGKMASLPVAPGLTRHRTAAHRSQPALTLPWPQQPVVRSDDWKPVH